MFGKLKGWGGYIISGVVAIISALVYIFVRRGEQLDSANARNNLHETDKQSAIIDTEVGHLEQDKKNINKDIDKDNTKLVDLQEERAKALDKQKAKKPNEIEDYWNK